MCVAVPSVYTCFATVLLKKGELYALFDVFVIKHATVSVCDCLCSDSFHYGAASCSAVFDYVLLCLYSTPTHNVNSNSMQ